jgi:hypothetical protein
VRRLIFTSAAALSLLLCLTFLTLFARSYWRYDHFSYIFPRQIICLDSLRGQMSLVDGRTVAATSNTGWGWSSDSSDSYPLWYSVYKSDFRHEEQSLPAGAIVQWWVFSHWIPAAITAIMPTIFVLNRRRGGKRGQACCSSCGYSLTGNVSGVCPECGTQVPSRKCGFSF